MTSSTSPLLLDRISFWIISACVAALTVLFACAYWALSVLSPENGLIGPDPNLPPRAVEFFYFSIVTQATIGYGDFRPVGFSRLVACIHGGAGIVMMGVLIAKITASSISRFRMLQRQACDQWVDVVRHHDGRVEVGILDLEVRDGAVQFAGRNFSPSGLLVDSFHSYLLEDDWPRSLTFRYTSHEGVADYVEGYVTLWFHAAQEGKPQSFSATVRDHLKPDTKPIIRGWRLTTDERTLVKKLATPGHAGEVIDYFLKKYLPHLPELPASRTPPKA